MKGFTLIELLIYITIVAVILVVFSSFGFRIAQNQTRTMVEREVEQNLRFGLEKINRAIRSASGINGLSPGATSSSISLVMDEPAKNPTVFDVSDFTLRIKEGGLDPAPITSSQVKVTNIVFTNTSYLKTPKTPGNIKIDLTIEYKNPSGRKEYDDNITLSTSASLRK